MNASVYKSEEKKELFRAAYNGFLNAMPFVRRTVDTPYGETFLLEAGEAGTPAVLLLHGSCSNSAFWFNDILALAGSYHVFAADIPGEAGNSSDVRLNLDNDDYAQWLSALLDALDLPRVSLAGNSLGGWMALKFATAFPERVEKLMLIASGGLADVRTEFLDKANQAKQTNEPLTMEESVSGGESLPKEVLDFINLILASYHPISVPLPVFSPEALRRLTMPVLYVTGGQDNLLDAEASLAAVRDNMPQAEIHLPPDAGHMITTPYVWMVPFLANH
ncbi:MAG: alpha/beta hydrolase [Clostridiales bacterium]|nr:alpha/beta hydrolase [Clostridiales bacterium]